MSTVDVNTRCQLSRLPRPPSTTVISYRWRRESDGGFSAGEAGMATHNLASNLAATIGTCRPPAAHANVDVTAAQKSRIPVSFKQWRRANRAPGAVAAAGPANAIPSVSVTASATHKVNTSSSARKQCPPAPAHLPARLPGPHQPRRSMADVSRPDILATDSVIYLLRSGSALQHSLLLPSHGVRNVG